LGNFGIGKLGNW